MVARRTLLCAIGTGVLVAPRWARAQPAGRGYRVGWAGTSSVSFKEPQALAFVQRLVELGFIEGRNLTIERRHGGNKLE